MKRRFVKKLIAVCMCGLLAATMIITPSGYASAEEPQGTEAEDNRVVVKSVGGVEFQTEPSDTAEVSPVLYVDETEADYICVASVRDGVSLKYEDTAAIASTISTVTGKDGAEVTDVTVTSDDVMRAEGDVVIGEYAGRFVLYEDANTQYVALKGCKEVDEDSVQNFIDSVSYTGEESDLYSEENLLDTLTLLAGEFTTAPAGCLSYDEETEVFRIGSQTISLVSTDKEIEEDLTAEQISDELHEFGTTLAKKIVTDKDGREWVVKKIEDAEGQIGLYAATSFNHKVYMFSVEPEDNAGDMDVLMASITSLTEQASISELKEGETVASNGGGNTGNGGSSNTNSGSGNGGSANTGTGSGGNSSGSGSGSGSGSASGGNGYNPDPNNEAWVEPEEPFYTTDGYQIVDLINQNIMCNVAPMSDGTPASVYWSSTAEAVAKRRAKEISVNYSHAGAEGLENIGMGGYSRCSSWFWAWYESPGHYETMCASGGCAYACYYCNGNYYAVYVGGY